MALKFTESIEVASNCHLEFFLKKMTVIFCKKNVSKLSDLGEIVDEFVVRTSSKSIWLLSIISIIGALVNKLFLLNLHRKSKL